MLRHISTCRQPHQLRPAHYCGIVSRSPRGAARVIRAPPPLESLRAAAGVAVQRGTLAERGTRFAAAGSSETRIVGRSLVMPRLFHCRCLSDFYDLFGREVYIQKSRPNSRTRPADRSVQRFACNPCDQPPQFFHLRFPAPALLEPRPEFPVRERNVNPLPLQCPHCTAEEQDLKEIATPPPTGKSFGPPMRVYTCKKCGTSFTHSDPPTEGSENASPPGTE